MRTSIIKFLLLALFVPLSLTLVAQKDGHQLDEEAVMLLTTAYESQQQYDVDSFCNYLANKTVYIPSSINDPVTLAASEVFTSFLVYYKEVINKGRPTKLSLLRQDSINHIYMGNTDTLHFMESPNIREESYYNGTKTIFRNRSAIYPVKGISDSLLLIDGNQDMADSFRHFVYYTDSKENRLKEAKPRLDFLSSIVPLSISTQNIIKAVGKVSKARKERTFFSFDNFPYVEHIIFSPNLQSAIVFFSVKYHRDELMMTKVDGKWQCGERKYIIAVDYKW